MGRTKAPTFDDFWRAYPLHRGKREAENAWNRLSAGDKQKALAGIPRYREYIEQTGTNIKYPQGWLNGRRWEDEYEDPIASFAAKFENGGHTATKTELSAKPRAEAQAGLHYAEASGKYDAVQQSPTPTDSADTLSDMVVW